MLLLRLQLLTLLLLASLLQNAVVAEKPIQRDVSGNGRKHAAKGNSTSSGDLLLRKERWEKEKEKDGNYDQKKKKMAHKQSSTSVEAETAESVSTSPAAPAALAEEKKAEESSSGKKNTIPETGSSGGSYKTTSTPPPPLSTSSASSTNKADKIEEQKVSNTNTKKMTIPEVGSTGGSYTTTTSVSSPDSTSGVKVEEKRTMARWAYDLLEFACNTLYFQIVIYIFSAMYLRSHAATASHIYRTQQVGSLSPVSKAILNILGGPRGRRLSWLMNCRGNLAVSLLAEQELRQS